MTDKQIIINDVNVSGCDFLAKEDDYCSYSGEYRAYKGQCGCSDEEMCKDHPNCFYKKALKQLKRKEQECEELKRLVAKQKNAKIQLSKLKDKQYKEFCDMKQILIEIKEIVETENNDIKILYNRRTYQRMKQILQKLNEVSNDR